MKSFIKYGFVGMIGYLIGFYEYKYKMMKALLEAKTKEDVSEENEAQ